MTVHNNYVTWLWRYKINYAFAAVYSTLHIIYPAEGYGINYEGSL